MGFQLLDGSSDGAVTALFVQTFETSENTLSKNCLLFLTQKENDYKTLTANW